METLQRVRIMILDPKRSDRNALRERLMYEGFEVEAFEGLEQGYAACGAGGAGYELLLIDGESADAHIASGARGAFGDASPVVLSGNPSIETAVQYIREGAWGFVPKPVDMNRLLTTIREVVAMRRAEEEFSAVVDRVARPMLVAADEDAQQDEDRIIGSSDSIRHVKSLIDRVGPSVSRVLITGPNGVGKELVARWLHRKSKRAGSPFVEVNCAAIPSELIESELFGHEKGAFTSAVKQRKGKFEQADGGTLFLDEIGDMSLSAQSKVLRALQEHKVSRVGGDRDIDVNVRVISATNKNLLDEIAAGRFREDLYHRLSVIIIHVPPLVERLDDIPQLVGHFVRQICTEYGIESKDMEAAAVERLQRREWTGNIRELRNVVERLIVLSGDRITEDDVMMYAHPLGVPAMIR